MTHEDLAYVVSVNICHFAILVQFSWKFHQNIKPKNWEYNTSFSEFSAHFLIGKGLIFRPRYGLGKSLIRFEYLSHTSSANAKMCLHIGSSHQGLVCSHIYMDVVQARAEK